MEKISVVIPVYNSEKYLRECLDSVLSQTYNNLEIICVNDGSTDNSLDILKEYAEKDGRIAIIDKENQGAATARNAGLKKATGEYVIFFDSDDYMSNNTLEELYKSSKENDADVTICKTNNINMHLGKIVPNELSVIDEYIGCKKVFSPCEFADNIFQFCIGWPWNKLYKRDFIIKNGLEFQNLRQSNDTYFVLMSLVLANKISVVDERLVVHRYHDKSLESTRFIAPECFYEALEKIRKTLISKNIYQTYKKSFLNYCVSFSVWHMTSVDEESQKVVKLYVKKILKKIRFISFKKSYWYDEWCYNNIIEHFYPLLWNAERRKCLIKRRILSAIQKIKRTNEYIRNVYRIVKFAIPFSDWCLTIKSLKNIKKYFLSKKEPPVLKSFVYHLADHCNLCCVGCDHFSPLAKPKLTDVEVFKSDIKRFSKISGKKLCTLKLMGGEPLLNPKVIDFMRISRKYLPKTRVELVTNGILLNSQPEKFWKACKKYSITIVVTKYPIKIDFRKAEENAQKYGIEYEYFGNTGEVIKTSYHIPLDLEGTQNPEENFKSCFHANNCIMMKNGRLYTCTIAPNIEHFNFYYGYNIPLDYFDGIDIFQTDSIQEIIDFLSKPIPFCKYCNVAGRTYENPWELSKRDVSEWT
ncbi:glycosyltransferase [bacterium]|nr:glycosyltransferase [bacterium]